MTTEELKNRVSFMFSGYGHKKVTIKYRNKEYSCTSTNTGATDRINSDIDGFDKNTFMFKTKKQAYLALYNECKIKNNLV